MRTPRTPRGAASDERLEQLARALCRAYFLGLIDRRRGIAGGGYGYEHMADYVDTHWPSWKREARTLT